MAVTGSYDPAYPADTVLWLGEEGPDQWVSWEETGFSIPGHLDEDEKVRLAAHMIVQDGEVKMSDSTDWLEPHDCRPDTWGCIICDIEAMRVRCLMGPGLETSSIVLGDDWVMIVPPRPFDADGFLRVDQ